VERRGLATTEAAKRLRRMELLKAVWRHLDI